ncbi:MAG: S41 family peptidase [Myxococcota bacterium]
MNRLRLLPISALATLVACPSTDDEPEPQVDRATVIEDWCEAVRGGPSRDEDPILGFAKAVSTARHFSVGHRPSDVTSDLVAVLSDVDLGEVALAEFADLSPERCVVLADDAPLGAFSAELRGDVALVQPGLGEATWPEGTEAVVIDLREVPATPQGDAALNAAVAAALASDVGLGKRWEQSFSGLPTDWNPSTGYTAGPVSVVENLVATGDRDLPLAFIVGARVSPRAAVLAAAFRVQGRAALWGFDLHTAIGESSWNPVGDRGLVVRTSPRELLSGRALPDVIVADTDEFWPEEWASNLSSVDGPRAMTLGVSFVPLGQWPGAAPARLEPRSAARQVMLIEAYGVLDRFYPYFDVVGRGLDDALLDELPLIADLQPGETTEAVHSLGRLMHALEDGHGFFNTLNAGPLDGYVGISGDVVDDEILVRAALPDIGIEPGDTVIEVDGQPVAEWYAEVTSRYSAASKGYLWDLATRELNQIREGRSLGVRAPDGSTRTVEAIPQSQADYQSLPVSGSLRESGTLGEFGRSDLYYLNMSQSVLSTEQELQRVVADLKSQDVSGIVVDMRSYPGVNHYLVVSELLTGEFLSPHFVVPTWTGPSELEWVEQVYELRGSSTAFDGPIALLVSNHSVSAAENFSLMLTQRDTTTVVGQQSASTNGTITGTYVADEHYIMFTGMQILTPERERFHGIGIVPDIVVEPTAAQIAAGVDPELQAALTVFER